MHLLLTAFSGVGMGYGFWLGHGAWSIKHGAWRLGA